ncbi:hypothetical protein P375_03710 [Gallibacterium genomosp. 2]|uniref:Capsular biosynthesis protein n=1 Tax=Gallibacterium genomosp. 2 TaxID=155517 RepID=A0A0A2XRI8_9PAST|nr:hypothetical protein [Gallibacterium genomosp. 2]KGQ33310.1 hypothetical protein P375_03710 [Gallibacterium genomosp. 2]
MILINSAAYVNQEFRNEFGSIPPSFLPIGNKKLLSYQVASIKNSFGDNEKIIVSLPQGYSLTIDEKKLINDLNVQIVLVPENITLGMAILYVLNIIDSCEDSIKLLHGDTLLQNFPNENDCIGIAYTSDIYEWEFKSVNDESLVWCGYFSFSSTRLFIQTLATTQGDFTESVYLYAKYKDISYKKVSDWYDLGHINTYFRSRSIITTQRAFNSLKIENGIVWKSGTPHRKIEAEAYWFEKQPPRLKRFIPQLIQSGKTDAGEPFYETEYLPLLPLNEIFVHGKHSAPFWENILDLLGFYMSECRKCTVQDFKLEEKVHNDSISLYVDKTYERLNIYAKQHNLNLGKSNIYNGRTLPSLNDIAKHCIEYTLKLPEIPSIVHGDLCFSNIMYDSRSNCIKVIDPRGLNFNQELSIYGNQTYDLAKLCHSFIGLYDFIIADSFSLEKSNDDIIRLQFNLDSRIDDIQKMFISKQLIPGIDNMDIIPAVILLFLSMIPLHFDKPLRQQAMLANAMRLYDTYIR